MAKAESVNRRTAVYRLYQKLGGKWDLLAWWAGCLALYIPICLWLPEDHFQEIRRWFGRWMAAKSI